MKLGVKNDDFCFIKTDSSTKWPGKTDDGITIDW